MNESDLLVVFGASFANHTGIASYKPIVQVDSDPDALGRFHPVTVPVLGDIARDRPALLARRSRAASCRTRSTSAPTSRPGARSGRRRRRGGSTDDRGLGVASAALFAALSPARARRRGDRGRRRQQHLLVRPLLRVQAASTVLMSGYLGSIGFGYPGRDGRVGGRARPADRRGHRRRRLRPVPRRAQHRGEVRHAITHVLLNNAQLGKISKEQRAAEWDVWQTSLHNPDFAEYAARLRRATASGSTDADAARRRARGGVRARRPGARRGHDRRRPRLMALRTPRARHRRLPIAPARARPARAPQRALARADARDARGARPGRGRRRRSACS